MADIAARQIVQRVGDMAERTCLMADLDHAIARALVRRAHGFGLFDRERHGLFLIDVFARAHGGDEAFGVQMLRRGDQDGIERRIVEHLPVIRVCLRAGCELRRVGEAAGVDIGEGGEFGIGTGDGLARELRAAVADADDADAEPVVRAEHASSRETTGETRGHVADEVSSGLHGFQSSLACLRYQRLSEPRAQASGASGELPD